MHLSNQLKKDEQRVFRLDDFFGEVSIELL